MPRPPVGGLFRGQSSFCTYSSSSRNALRLEHQQLRRQADVATVIARLRFVVARNQAGARHQVQALRAADQAIQPERT
ncbi:hypothetical protein CR918_14605 [Stenotrophomonas indicatrix]|nr:hypothetical protein CR918_14605 [Stenotrophomonas indicatrix]